MNLHMCLMTLDTSFSLDCLNLICIVVALGSVDADSKGLQ